jgi:DNA-directed RNA polymerase specialized sigma24 family protein
MGALHGTQDDFRQQVALWALEAMPKYDPQRSLSGFILIHARNQALNWVRKHHHRSDAPCAKCHAGSPCGEDGQCCPMYTKWAKRNQAKANLARPVGLDHAGERPGPTAVDDEIASRELFQVIDAQLPIELRSYYLRMLAGDTTVGTTHRQKVQQAIAEILDLDLPTDGRVRKRKPQQPAAGARTFAESFEEKNGQERALSG